MSEEKRNDAQTEKGAGNDVGKQPESKPSTAGGAQSPTPSQQPGGAQAPKPAGSSAASAPAKTTAARSKPKKNKVGAGKSASTASVAPQKSGSGVSAAAGPGQSDNASPARPDPARTASSPTGTVPPARRHSNNGSDESGGKPLLLAIIALIIAILAIIGSGWLWYRGEQKLASLDSRVNTVEQGMQSSVQKVVMPRLSEFDKRLQSLSKQSEESAQKLKQQLEQQSQKLASTQQAMHAAQSQTADLSDQIKGNVNRWYLNQIESLLQAANQRLQLFDDPQGARQALQLANDAIGRKGDPRLFNVRSEIVNEIAALRALPNPDIEGRSLALAAMIKQVPDLPLASSVPGEYDKATAANNSGGESSGAPAKGQNASQGGDGGMTVDKFKARFTQGWGHFKDSVGEALSGMMTIRRADGTQSALLPPDQVFFLNQNLQLQLRTARLALLEGHTDSYHDSLATAKQWLGDYYDTSASAVSSMRKQLGQMSNVKLDWEAPDISKSLAMLRDIKAKRAGGDTSAGASSSGGASDGQEDSSSASADTQPGDDAGQGGQ